MIEQFTVEEINLICIYNTENRNELISELIEMTLDCEDGELFQIAQNVLKKISDMSDYEYAALEFYPEYGDYEQEEAID